MPAYREDISAGRARKRLIIAGGAVLTVVITVFGVLQLLPSGDNAKPATAADEPATALTATELTNEFLNELTAGDAAAAGKLTDDAAAATKQLGDVWQGLAPTSLVASRDELVEPAAGATVAVEPFTLSWDLGDGRAWEYKSSLRLARKGADWLVRWQPGIVHPNLAAGQRLVLHDLTGQPAVVGRGGAPLITWTGDGTTAKDPRFAPLLLPAMGRVARGRTPADGWYVASANAAGKDVRVLHGRPTKPLASTLSQPVQAAAQTAVDGQAAPTMIVAIQPSTGDLLAVAQNAAAGDDLVALHGLFPPGSTFKIATATALLDAGIAGIETVVPCPGSATIGQRTVRNAGFELGDVPLRTAFAQSCNTTFAMQAAKLPPGALPRAASRLGLAADFAIPGIKTEAGTVPAAANSTEQVENSIGQGRVVASCFGMALVAATVAAGRAITPRLWRDLKTTVNAGYEPPPGAVVASLRTMMRDVVTSGRGSALDRYGDVHGKTGTAQFDDGTQAHGWFAGYRGDLAFATLVKDSSSSSAAVTVTGAFLGGIG
ncbi:MAG TPA: penicillin-binding transpeptidase domain-containing protein [Actinophytocola sp.]|uniref:penicillin-binding transpeptidase domain-containing protein n=1 Tax=Actinophytocola sp. TaxID=1872138 RepID=UPI002F923B95